jgi:hypothetical protein
MLSNDLSITKLIATISNQLIRPALQNGNCTVFSDTDTGKKTWVLTLIKRGRLAQ